MITCLITLCSCVQAASLPQKGKNHFANLAVFLPFDVFMQVEIYSTTSVSRFTGCLHLTNIIQCLVRVQTHVSIDKSQMALLLSSGGLFGFDLHTERIWKIYHVLVKHVISTVKL